MKRLILFFALLTAVIMYANAFNPNDMDEVTIEKAMPCGEYICALVKNDGEHFVIVGAPKDGVFFVSFVYRIEDGKPVKVWDATWRQI